MHEVEDLLYYTEDRIKYWLGDNEKSCYINDNIIVHKIYNCMCIIVIITLQFVMYYVSVEL